MRTDGMIRGAASLVLALAPVAQARGEAAFDNAVLYGAGPIPEAVAIGDLDGDRDQDLAVVNRSGHLQVLFNNGNGTFQNAVAYNSLWPSGPTGGYTLDVRIADLDRDGDNDLAVAFTSIYGSISILRNNGNGTFALPPVNYDSCYSTQGITVGDFNGDLHRDVAGMTNCFQASILLNDGHANFQKKGDYGDGYVPGGIDSADLDGDRDLDIVYSNGTNDVTTLFNDGTGAFDNYSGFAAHDQPRWMALGDYDKDGDNDLAITAMYTNDVSLFTNNGSGLFAGPTKYSVGTAPNGLVEGDFDNDGDLDLIAANHTSDNVTFRWNSGNGTFPTLTTKSTCDGSDRVAVGDLNGDARLDIAVSCQNGNTVAILINRLNAAPDADGDGVTDASDCAPTNPSAWTMASDVSDLLLSGPGPTKISWSVPDRTGSNAPRYDVLRSASPSGFLGATCIVSDGTGTIAFDAEVPAPLLAYLVRAENACGGTLGTDSSGVPRTGALCP